MRLKFSLAMTLLFTLAACGGDKKTQNKIDSANDDNRRLGVIERELYGLGVSLPDPQYSSGNVRLMDASSRARTRDLLNEFIARVNSIQDVTNRRGVEIKDPARLQLIRGEADQARALLNAIDALNAQGSRRQDCAGNDTRAFTSVAKRGAIAFVRGLDPEIADRIDVDRPSAAPVAGSCGQVRVTFSDRYDSGCFFGVVMDRGTVVHSATDQQFHCR